MYLYVYVYVYVKMYTYKYIHYTQRRPVGSWGLLFVFCFHTPPPWTQKPIPAQEVSTWAWTSGSANVTSSIFGHLKAGCVEILSQLGAGSSWNAWNLAWCFSRKIGSPKCWNHPHYLGPVVPHTWGTLPAIPNFQPEMDHVWMSTSPD